MIDRARIHEILKQYEKHGWTLRRVLLCREARESLSGSPENPFGGAQIADSETNAVWFSRRAANGNEAWELRRLTGSPFAVIKVFGADINESEREQIRREAETMLSGKR